MGNHGIKFNLKLVHVVGLVVGLHDTVSNGTFFSLLFCNRFSGQLLNFCSFCLRNQGLTVNEINAAIV